MLHRNMGRRQLYYAFGISSIFILIVFCYNNMRFSEKFIQKESPVTPPRYRTNSTGVEAVHYQNRTETVERHDVTINEMYPIFQSMLNRIRDIWHQGRSTDKRFFDDQYINIAGQLQSLIRRSETTRSEKLKKLSDHVWQRILEMQNPPDCDKARLLVYNYGHAEWGFGCTVHLTLRAFFHSVYTKRTLVLDGTGWAYGKQRWESYLLPIGKCRYEGDYTKLPRLSKATKDERVVQAGTPMLRMYNRCMPKNILDELDGIYTEPFSWWAGQFLSYLFRLQPWFEKELKDKAKRIGFQAPVIGVHIRWGTKLTTHEALKHEVSEYMDFVETWYRKLEYEGRQENRSVFVATEESEAWKSLKENYSYAFFGAGYADESKDADNFNTNYYDKRKDAFPSILTDIYFLDKCDYIVCTLSSNVCKVVYGLQTARAADVSNRIQSLDNVHAGLGLCSHFVEDKYLQYRVIQDHSEYNNDEKIDLKIGDVVSVVEDPFHPVVDGYIRYRINGKGKVGKVPAYKVKQIIETLDFAF